MTVPLRPYLLAFGATSLALLASFGASQARGLEPVGVVVVAGVAALLYRRSFALGTAVVLVELAAGSLGRSFVLPWGGLSVRMVLFAVALAATAWELRRPDLRRHLTPVLRHPATLLLAAAVAWGATWGLTQRPFGRVFSDLNAYLYLLLLPTYVLALRNAKDRAMLLSAVLGAVAAGAVQTLLLFFLYTHATPEPVLRASYVWIRDFGFGEITRAPGGFYRVFFQAHLWTFAVFLMAPALYVAARTERDRAAPGDPTLPNRLIIEVSGILAAAVVFVSFSRTFWLAAAVAAALGALTVAAWHVTRPKLGAYLLALLVFAALGIGLPFLLSRSVSGAAFSRVGAVAGEPAADSRMNLLRVMWPAIREQPLLGHGFGKELTYVTRDPRLLAYFPDGNYTTSAFEWGWLDFWLKMGLVGPIAFAFFLCVVLWRSWQAAKTDPDGPWLHIGLGLAVLGTAGAHLLSPWLNHPLGIGVLLLAYGISGTVRPGTSASRAAAP